MLYLILLLPSSANGGCRVLYRKTLGTGTRGRIGSPNTRPVVYDRNIRSFVIETVTDLNLLHFNLLLFIT